MKTEIEVPDYTPESGLRIEWDYGFDVSVSITEGEVVIAANSAGLRSLARLLLTLSQDGVPVHHHVHLDESNALEDGSSTLILERK